MGFTGVGQTGAEKGLPGKYLSLNPHFCLIVKDYLNLGHLFFLNVHGQEQKSVCLIHLSRIEHHPRSMAHENLERIVHCLAVYHEMDTMYLLRIFTYFGPEIKNWL
jgi:hypothetical protein